jgi:serine/threonine-protein kinase RIM15
MQLSPKLKDLLEGLFKKNPKERLGSKGPEEIRKHPWFDKISWQTL